VFPDDSLASPSLSGDERPLDADLLRIAERVRPRFAQRYWLHFVLLVTTVFTTCLVGARMQQSFHSNLPLGVEDVWDAFVSGWRNPAALVGGLPFSLTLLTILMAHELGHFVTCMYYRLDASLPYFLPAPVLTGTFGAFIRIRAPIYYKRVLFDVAVGGPLAGFLFLLPALAIGVAYSKVIPGIANEGSFHFGTPLLLWLIEKAIFPGVAVADIYLHPVARAAWVGLLATGWNLLPIGQLDGGHVLYSVAGNRHRALTWVFLGALVVLGIFFWRWWFFWVLLLYFGRKHPTIVDDEALGPDRKKLAWLMLLIFILCFTPAPIRENAG
jgi:membrane-associated protease RseP (regulator of RpoE activity)